MGSGKITRAAVRTERMLGGESVVDTVTKQYIS
jgi:hypothetical protein